MNNTENQWKSDGKPMENLWESMGNKQKTHEKHGKQTENRQETNGKQMKNIKYGNHGKSWKGKEKHRKSMRIIENR